MSRLHNTKKGKSGSKRPQRTEAPSWQGLDRDEVETEIVKLARQGRSSAYIGLVLRDQFGIPSVRLATGKTVTEIMRANQLYPEVPEDVQHLMRRAAHLSEHLRGNPKDNHNARGLQLIESKIRRLARYYKRQGVLPPDWKYSMQKAKLSAAE
ncbi:MAG: 30S ribosomal protein S15 [Methanobacteriota archaeon]